MEKVKSTTSDAQKRAKRLLMLREMLNLSRNKIDKRYNIARGTLQNWESARFGGLTAKGAKSIIRAYRAEGVECTEDWLMHGIGAEPVLHKGHPAYQLTQTEQNRVLASDHHNITNEILYFRAHNSQAIDMIITDNAMEPWLKIGDIVAGVRFFREQIEKLVGQTCIIQTAEYGTLVRKLYASSQKGTYNLQATNIDQQLIPTCLTGVHILSAAKVIWMRSTHISL